MVAVGVTFPLTWAITQAFTRRERALQMLAELKASITGLYFHHRDWAQVPGFPDTLGHHHEWAQQFASVAMDFLDNMQKYIGTADGYEGLADMRMTAKRHGALYLLVADTNLHQANLGHSFVRRVTKMTHDSPGHSYLMAAYQCLSKISVMNEYLTFKANYTRGGEGGLSRTSQYLRYLMAQMEQLRMIKEYRTPVMLRHSCAVITHLGAVLLAPYFNHVGRCDDWEDKDHMTCPAAYMASAVYVVIAMLLLNVQASVEQPFDMNSLDDVFLELAEEFDDIIQLDPVDGIHGVADSGACFEPVRRRHHPAAPATKQPADLL
eukprot:jgi/Chrzof1/3257/Cz12g18040.t1